MTFQTQLVADMAAIFINEWAISATLRTRGATTGGSTVSVVISDPDPSIVGMSSGIEDRREAQIVLLSSTVATVLSRSLERGDQVIVASGAYAGTWIVTRAQADLGGGTTAHAALADLHAPGAPGAREVR
jgi:hypothetical protein